jgi:hypothetical protein
METPFEQVFGPISEFLKQPAPTAVSLIGTIIAFLCLLWSIANTFWSTPDDEWRPKVMAFVKAIVVVAFMANSGTLINGTSEVIAQVYQSSGAGGDGIRQTLDNIRSNNVAARAYRAEQAPGVLDFFNQMKTLLEALLVSVGKAGVEQSENLS